MVQYSRVKGTSVNILRAGIRIPLREETGSVWENPLTGHFGVKRPPRKGEKNKSSADGASLAKIDEKGEGSKQINSSIPEYLVGRCDG